ncbi:hypothetical protein [Natronincola ferrireducens]|uniref:N-acetyltransferase domain-containing protein n=1 Tax=Natronincola ferrireducens TaxID=393762 RepID=A0A1G8ZH06_9FIRM|nr:hypothetical protein [Natronincola ferrireducens]SDK14402.1 hypothetical protein SAMN05660472_00863 [Natronincola ferrireducens]
MIKSKLTLEDFLAMETLEKKYYDEAYITDALTSYSWYQHWPHCIRCLKHDDQIIGFINLFPVSLEIYQTLLDGTFNDKHLVKEHMDVPRDVSKSYHLFLSCVVIDAPYRKTSALNDLLKDYVTCYETYEAQGFVFESVITDNVTDEGVRFSKTVGLEIVTKSNHNSIICAGSFTAFKEAISQRIQTTSRVV